MTDRGGQIGTGGPPSGGEGASRGLAFAICCAAVVYFAAQFFVYFSETTFYGIGINYLLNFETVTGPDYLDHFVLHTGFYPPLYYLFIYVAHALFGFDYLPILGANALFVVGGAVYLYLAGARLAGRAAGAAAFAFFMLAPATTVLSKTLLIEAPLVMFLPAFIYHALASEGFRRAGHAALAGLFFALGMLTKWSFLAYALPVALVVCYPLFQTEEGTQFERPSATRWRNLLIGLVVLCALALPWYLGSFEPGLFEQSAKNDPTFPGAAGLSAFGLKLAFNWRNLRLLAGGSWLVELLGAVVVCALVRGPGRGRLLAWTAAALAPVALFALPNHLEDRYLWPIFVTMSILAGIAFATVMGSIRIAAVRRLLALLLCVWLVWNNWDNFVRERGIDEPVLVDRNYADGTLLWERADADRVLAAVEEYADAVDPGGPPVRLAPHPLALSHHIAASHLAYHRLHGAARFARVRVVPMDFYNYPVLSAGLRDGSMDFVALDADRFDRFLAPDFDPDTDPLAMLYQRDYVDQNTGERFPALDRERFLEDVRILTTVYRPVAELPLAKSTVRILASPRFTPATEDPSTGD